MRINLSKLVSLLAGTAAVLGCFSGKAAANSTFKENLPPGYQLYSGALVVGQSCSCADFGLPGAPKAPPCPETTDDICFGSSNTRYAWAYTDVAGIKGEECVEKQQEGLTIGPCFQLDGDDAVVIYGKTPDQITYYSMTLYNSLAYNQSAGDYALTMASINLDLNNRNLQTANSSPFNSNYAIIVTSNTGTLNAVRNALIKSGIPAKAINNYIFPAKYANAATSATPEQLSFLLRMTTQTTQERQRVDTFAQQTAPNTKVVFVKAPGTTGDVTDAQLKHWEDNLRTDTTEYQQQLDKKLDSLQANVVNYYQQQGYTLKHTITETLKHSDPVGCNTNYNFCAYDSPNAIYTSYVCDFAQVTVLGCAISPKQGDFLMLIGVDHSSVVADPNKGLATYFSYESKGAKGESFSFVGLYTQGSANRFFPLGDGSNLFAIRISPYSCGDDPYCVIPYSKGSPEDENSFFLLGRVYLDKVTATGPNPANLIPARLLWFTKSNQ
ncbi:MULTISPECIES: hypothetical protein [Fischerella]|uniref:Uncharacterized protein n=1 Tax=Fischerella muscicola CCMEE 5323 TaxID=2019572 RepID=A0A2N6JX55_FISMU|nr:MULTISPECIES: hypothetical protein [Fischerella]MBD2429614.1 hypothetical protein [Fischerella sp. FACHB-380]PLZ84854.1 hypothetical protein CEN44_23500 [Fischerella muscicola CCMEE 5323]